MSKEALHPELRKFIYEMNGGGGISKAPGEGQRRDTEADRR